MKNTHIYHPEKLTNIIPGINGLRAFPTVQLQHPNPFILLDHLGEEQLSPSFFVDGAGHDHPHRGFETLTFLFQGEMTHRDSLGNTIALTSGAVQRMHAGKGIIHGGSFSNDRKSHLFHELQLWINVAPAQKMTPPEIQTVHNESIPNVRHSASIVRVISGKFGAYTGPINTITPTQIAHIIMPHQDEIRISDIHPKYDTWLYVLSGKVSTVTETIDKGQLYALPKGATDLVIQSNEAAQLLLLGGRPIAAPTIMGGPFVMNTSEEITQAYADFKNGAFGTI